MAKLIEKRQIENLQIKDVDVAAGANIETSKLLDGPLFVKSNGTVPFLADQSMSTHKLTDLAEPTNNNDALRLIDLLDFSDEVNALLLLKANIAGQVFTGNISAPNLSGTNTGDQDLSPYQLRSEKNVANGYLGLNGSALVDPVYLPSYVDDVIDIEEYADLPVTGEKGKIYIIETAGVDGGGDPFPANSQFRWTGSAYVKMVASPGTTDDVPEGVVNLYYTDARVAAYGDLRYHPLENQRLGTTNNVTFNSLTATTNVNAATFNATPSNVFTGDAFVVNHGFSGTPFRLSIGGGGAKVGIEFNYGVAQLIKFTAEGNTLINTDDDISGARLQVGGRAKVTGAPVNSTDVVRLIDLDTYALKDGTNATGTWPISVTGNAATATAVAWSGITSKPTTLSGYGITDAYTKTQSDNRYMTLSGAAQTVSSTKLFVGGFDIAGAFRFIDFGSNTQTMGVSSVYNAGTPTNTRVVFSNTGIFVLSHKNKVEILNDLTLTNTIFGDGRMSGADAVNSNEFVTKGQLDAFVPTPPDLTPYALKDGTNATGTWPIGITGNAATATLWGGRGAELTTPTTGAVSHMLIFNSGGDGLVRVKHISNIRTDFGLDNGSTLANSISGNATTAATATTANGLGILPLSYTPATAGIISNVMVATSSNELRPASLSAMQAWLGVSSGGETLQSVTDRADGTSDKLRGWASDPSESMTLGTQPTGFSILSANKLYGLFTGVGGSGNVWFQAARNDANTATYDILLNPNGGNVGIGMDPTYKLDVNGAGNFSGNVSASGTIAATSYISGSRGVFGFDTGTTGSVNASGWFNSSGGTGWRSNDWGGGIHMTDASWVRTYNGVGFYSTSVIRSDTYFMSGNYGSGLVGQYDASLTQSVFAMGTSYRLPIGGGTLAEGYGSFYGLGWSYNPDYGGAGNNAQSKPGLNHQLLIMNAAVTQTAIGSGIWTVGNVTSNPAPTIGDHLCNKTYVDAAIAAGGSGISLTTTGTSGPATLIGGVLNIPQYGGSFELTSNKLNTITFATGNSTNYPSAAALIGWVSTTGSGTTAVAISNVTIVSTASTFVTKVGGGVICSGYIYITLGSTGASQIAITPPYSSNFGSATHAYGTAWSEDTRGISNFYIEADAATDKLLLNFKTTAGTGQTSATLRFFSHYIIQ